MSPLNESLCLLSGSGVSRRIDLQADCHGQHGAGPGLLITTISFLKLELGSISLD
jgi:hypothetical protein